MGMTLIRQSDYPHGEFTLAFLGYGSEEEGTVIELTHNWDNRHYELGDAYGHIAISVESIDEFIKMNREDINKLGGQVTLEPKIMSGTTTKLAFIADPDGYKIELLERT